MKTIILLILLFTQLNLILAQQNTGTDILPLNIGNEWSYTFNTGWANSFVHESTTDTGVAEYKIISKSVTNDSTIWSLFQIRKFIRKISGWQYDLNISDTVYFDLIELNKDYHELYTSEFNNSRIFPFKKGAEDTSKFYRYISASFIGDTLISLNYPDPTNNYPWEDFRYEFTVRSDTGIVKVNYKHSFMGGWDWARYYLQKFKPYYSMAHLYLPQKRIIISTLARTPLDTLIKFINNGSETLIISNVSSTDSRFQVLDFTREVFPDSIGSIWLRFDSIIQETVSAELLINCNSVDTENKIRLFGNSYEKAVIDLQPSNSINFDGVFNGDTNTRIYSITNKGNLVLTIDSIKISNSVFTNSLTISHIYPNQIVYDTVYFSPTQTSVYSGELFIYSNSETSVNVIKLSANSAEAYNTSLGIRKVNFGKVQFGGSKDTTIIIKNNGTESIFFNKFIRTGNPNYIESLFVFADPEYYKSKEIMPNSSYYEVIKFVPRNDNRIAGSVIFEFFKPNFGLRQIDSVQLDANINYYLSQNYPNPFNPATTIEYSIPELMNVRIDVYNILGEKMITLVNEQKPAGDYQVKFNSIGLASGVYFYRVQAGNFIGVKKMILIK